MEWDTAYSELLAFALDIFFQEYRFKWLGLKDKKNNLSLKQLRTPKNVLQR